MAVVSLPSSQLGAYLAATRGNFKLVSPPLYLSDVGVRLLASLRADFPDVAELRIAFVRSQAAQPETVTFFDSISCVVYDVTFNDIIAHYTVAYNQSAARFDQPTLFDVEVSPAWVFALAANRFLSHGDRYHAAAAANIYLEFASGIPDPDLRLVIIQSTFILAHELAHCQGPTGPTILAHRISDFLVRILTHLQPDFDRSHDRRVERIVARVKQTFPGHNLSNEELSEIRAFAESVSDPDTDRARLADPNDHPGVEAICDVFAAYWTNKLLVEMYGWDCQEILSGCLLAMTLIESWKLLSRWSAGQDKQAAWEFVEEFSLRQRVMVNALRALQVINFETQNMRRLGITNNEEYVSTFVPMLTESDRKFQVELMRVLDVSAEVRTSGISTLGAASEDLRSMAELFSKDREFMEFQATPDFDDWICQSIQIA